MKVIQFLFQTIVGVSTLFGWCIAAQAGKKNALLIGIDKYDSSSQLVDLKYASADVLSLASTLRASGYDSENIKILESSSSKPDRVPSKANILKALRKIVASNKATGEDSILLVFAGHGFNNNGESCLCPSDFNASAASESSLSVSEVANMLAQSQASEKYFVIDACRSEVTSTEQREFNLLSGLRRMRITKEQSPQGIVFFSSCLAGQYSFEDPQTLKHGVFMHHFREALDGYADFQGGNHDGKVSAFEAIEYTSKKTVEYVQTGFHANQRPWADSHSTAELCLSVLSPEKVKRLSEKFGTIEKIDPLALAQRQQAEAETQAAVEHLAYSDFDETIRFANRAIQADDKYFPARHIRSLLYMVQDQDYENALLQMKAAGSDLRVRVAGEIQVRSETNVVGTATPGDVLKVSSVIDHGNEKWIQVVGIQKRSSDSVKKTSYIPVVGFVQVSSLKNPETAKAQMREFFTPQKAEPSRPVVSNYDTRPNIGFQPTGERLQRAENAINTYNAVSGIVNRVSDANLPSIPNVPSMIRGRLPW